MSNLQKWFLVGAVWVIALGLFKIGFSLQKIKPQPVEAVANSEVSESDFELQEICSKKADEVYRESFEGTNQAYQRHYNKKLNKCFMRTWRTSSQDDQITLTDSIVDAYDGKDYATFFSNRLINEPETITAHVLGKECHSKAEYDILAKPLMEE